MKKCGKCDTLKKNEKFNKRKASDDGLQSMCKKCQLNYLQGTQTTLKKKVRKKKAPEKKALKTCNKCGKLKFIELFPKVSKNKDGKGATCKECKQKYMKKYHASRKAKRKYCPQWLYSMVTK